jgi:hypothetical protein
MCSPRGSGWLCFAGDLEIQGTATQALHEKLIKIGAKVVRHGRYVTFQLDEVAISRRLFAEIPRLNDGPRPKPAPT